jgi:hypothetical protein
MTTNALQEPSRPRPTPYFMGYLDGWKWRAFDPPWPLGSLEYEAYRLGFVDAQTDCTHRGKPFRTPKGTPI